MRDWHRVFGVSLADVVTGLPFEVVQELELSRPKQRLDVAIIRLTETRISEHRWPELPDGLTDLADHNLVSYKSIRESLTCGAMWELVSHAVIYGKQHWKKAWEAGVADRLKLRLIAVTTHHPAWLMPAADAAQGRRTDTNGVYELGFLQLVLRVIVPSEMAKTPRNALWHLLSGDRELVRYGMEHYQARDAGLYNILNDLRQSYAMEGVEMPYTKEDYKREVARELFLKAPPADRRDWLDQLPAEERLGRLSPDERYGLSPDERLSGLSPEQIEAYLDKLHRQAGRAGGKSEAS